MATGLVVVLALGLLKPEVDQPCVGVAIYTPADIPGPILVRASAETGRIYRKAGLTLVWRKEMPGPADSVCRAELMIRILARPMAKRVSRSGEMGVATGSATARGRLAYLFLDRILRKAHEHGVELSVVLAHVLAHEIGHLVLPYKSHSASGLMRANWQHQEFEAMEQGSFGLTQEQAATIAASLARHPQPLAPNR